MLLQQRWLGPSSNNPLFQGMHLGAGSSELTSFVRFWTNSGQRWILACDGLSANDPKRTFSGTRSSAFTDIYTSIRRTL